MTPRKTPGIRLVESLRGLLDQGYEFDEAEEHLLEMIEAETDRVAALRAVLADELAKAEVSTRRVTELSAEIRLLEKQIGQWSASLRPKQTEAKSWTHQKAANTRWRTVGGLTAL
ncbi:hypothetical protein QEN35_20940 [Gordonia alkanivorans]|uniref:hypothetical protein n=1 Tax=Gordonia alkanivorans TaxID=84096 RepID=UPI001F4E917E|nr:hypothetical protein [Gordonia alkanivorans]MDH3026826.1 hypothetical protein [Gordonia alkanivorans]